MIMMSSAAGTHPHFPFSAALLVLWVIVACIVRFAQHASASHHALDTSTWLTCLFLFAATALFLYMHQV